MGKQVDGCVEIGTEGVREISAACYAAVLSDSKIRISGTICLYLTY